MPAAPPRTAAAAYPLVRRCRRDTGRRDQTSDVARVLRRDASTVPVLEGPHDTLDAGRPLVPMALVHTVVLADVGRANVGMRQQELADRGVEREAMHALPRRVHEHRARAVQDVSGGDLRAAFLQTVGERAWPLLGRTAPMYRK